MMIHIIRGKSVPISMSSYKSLCLGRSYDLLSCFYHPMTVNEVPISLIEPSFGAFIAFFFQGISAARPLF